MSENQQADTQESTTSLQVVKGKVTVGNRVFSYWEIAHGTGSGPRGIGIGTNGDRTLPTYRINPNPHDCKKYNSKQQTFYYQVAEKIGEYYNSHNNAWPPLVYGKAGAFELYVKLCKNDYYLTSDR